MCWLKMAQQRDRLHYFKIKKKWARFFGGIHRIYPSGIHFFQAPNVLVLLYFNISFPFKRLWNAVEIADWLVSLVTEGPAWDFSWMSYSVTSLYKGKNFSNSFLRGTWLTDPNFMAVHPSNNTSWWHESESQGITKAIGIMHVRNSVPIEVDISLGDWKPACGTKRKVRQSSNHYDSSSGDLECQTCTKFHANSSGFCCGIPVWKKKGQKVDTVI